jgi:hypothetical protein
MLWGQPSLNPELLLYPKSEISTPMTPPHSTTPAFQPTACLDLGCAMILILAVTPATRSSTTYTCTENCVHVGASKVGRDVRGVREETITLVR